MRGTRSVEDSPRFNHGIIPAHAGNTSSFGCLSAAPRDHPRACGEHEGHAYSLMAPGGSSPRMRGTRFMGRYHAYQQGIIPAHAGNTRRSKALPVAPRDHPRACGEHDNEDNGTDVKPGSSPRMRGTRYFLQISRHLIGIIPAHSGNTSWPESKLMLSRDHPRACGEH